MQRKVALNTSLVGNNLKGLKVSSGGALGVVFIPDVVAKPEVDGQSAVDISTSINTVMGGVVDGGWSVSAPSARLAQVLEVAEIAKALNLRNQTKPGSVGDQNRVAAMVAALTTRPENVVIYEQAPGTDFVNHLADGALNNAAAKKQSKKGQPKTGSGLAQLADPGYARHLGRIAALDIFMGHRDRLHGAGNFENWMSDVRSRRLTLVDNDISNLSLANWSTHQDVQQLTNQQYPLLANTIVTEIDSLLNHQGYGGGKLGAKDLAVWQNTIRPVFQTCIEAGLQAGRLKLLQRGWGLVNALRVANSPLADRLEERLNHLHNG